MPYTSSAGGYFDPYASPGKYYAIFSEDMAVNWYIIVYL